MLSLRVGFLCAVFALAACGGTTSEQVVSPSGVRCQIGLTAPAGALPPSGSNVSLNLNVPRDCTWAASTDATWLSISPTSGQGTAVLSLAAAANAQPSPRSASVVVNDSSVVVRQEPAPCRFELSHQGMRFGSEGGRISVRVSTIDGCEWRVSGATEWLHVATPAGTGTGLVDIEASRNGGSERNAALTIGGTPLPVVQDGSSGAPPNPGDGGPGSPGCSYAIDPERLTIRASAGQGSVRVVTDPGCGWSASSASSWLTVSRGSGSGPDTVTYQAAANTSTASERTGTVVVGGRAHRVTQGACEFALESQIPNLGPSGGTHSFSVSTAAGCTWIANSNADWIVVETNGGTGSGAVRFRVAPNPIERDRSGTITVSGRPKLILQQALGQS